jgi:hypothetical protein
MRSLLIGRMKKNGKENENQELLRNLLIRFSATTRLVEIPVFINIFTKVQNLLVSSLSFSAISHQIFCICIVIETSNATSAVYTTLKTLCFTCSFRLGKTAA